MPSPRVTTLPAAAALLVTALVATLVAVVVPLAAAAPAGAATTMPTAANTGVPSGVALKRVTGMLLLDQAGKTYSGYEVLGQVRVAAPNVTFANSIVRGDNRSSVYGLVDANNPGYDHRGFTIRDTTIIPTYRTAYQGAGILGHDFTATRVEITKTVDGVHVTGNNVVVQSSWIHDTTYFSASASPFGSDTHNDGVQVVAGSNILVTGNTISGNSNAGLMVTQDAGVTSNLRFTDNWSSGGACTVNITRQGRSSIGGMTVTSNRFLHDTRNPNCAILRNTGVTMTTSGNVWRDTNTPVALSRGQ